MPTQDMHPRKEPDPEPVPNPKRRRRSRKSVVIDVETSPKPVVVLDTIIEDRINSQPVGTVSSDEDAMASSKVDISGVFSPTGGAISPSAAASSNVDDSGLHTLLNCQRGAPRFKRRFLPQRLKRSTEQQPKYRVRPSMPTRTVVVITMGRPRRSALGAVVFSNLDMNPHVGRSNQHFGKHMVGSHLMHTIHST